MTVDVPGKKVLSLADDVNYHLGYLLWRIGVIGSSYEHRGSRVLPAAYPPGCCANGWRHPRMRSTILSTHSLLVPHSQVLLSHESRAIPGFSPQSSIFKRVTAPARLPGSAVHAPTRCSPGTSRAAGSRLASSGRVSALGDTRRCRASRVPRAPAGFHDLPLQH